MSASSEKRKGISPVWKLVIIAGALALIFLGLAIGAAFASPAQAKSAIDRIGKVSYTAESKEKIDNAIKSYDVIGKNGLKDSKHFGAKYLRKNASAELTERLENAKKEYVRLAIRAVDVAEKRREVDHHTDEEIVELIAKARAAAEEYFKGEFDKIATYATLLSYEEKYGVSSLQPSHGGGTSSEEDVEIELC